MIETISKNVFMKASQSKALNKASHVENSGW
jgi:hypothetical protein